MNSNLLHQLRKYKKMIIEESYENIIYEMLTDLKSILLQSKDVEFNLTVLEAFHDISSSNCIERLYELEDMLTEGISISNIKVNFFNKHEKIIQRDKKWLAANKKKILGLNFEEIELEVLSDYKVSFEQLLNRHNIFDKAFVNTNDSENIGDKLRRFEDKNENLKNGLDNYFRTGTSRREIGIRKVKGEEARMAIENMVAYCESFLAGRQFLEEKMNTIIVSISDASVKESLYPIDRLKILLEADESLKDINNASKELANTTQNKKQEEPKSNETSNKSSLNDIKSASKNLANASNDKKQNNNKEEKPVNNKDVAEDDNLDDEPVDKEPAENTEEPKEERGMEDRQMGIAVLLTVAEERYFDYINILKGLIEE